jgi:hypothetical protein
MAKYTYAELELYDEPEPTLAWEVIASGKERPEQRSRRCLVASWLESLCLARLNFI